MKFPSGTARSAIGASFTVSDGRGVLDAPETDILWTFADHAPNDAQPRNGEVDDAVAVLEAAAARAEALELNRLGQFEGSSARLKRTWARLSSSRRPGAVALAQSLQDEAPDYSAPMSDGEMKRKFSDSLSASRMRDESGKARRKP